MKTKHRTFASTFFIIYTAFVWCFSVQAQTPKKVSLIAANCKAGQKLCTVRELWRYDFRNGKFLGKSKILESESLSVNNEAVIYKNRYIITISASIIDLQLKKIIHWNKGRLFSIDGNRVLSIMDDLWADIDRPMDKGVFLFDLNTGKYEKITSDTIWSFNDEVSPDKKRTAIYNNESKMLEVFTLGAGKKTFQLSLNIENTKEYCGHNPFVPVIWIDNERMLTQKTNGELITVDIEGKTEPFINFGNKSSCPPDLKRDGEGNLIYRYDREYLINVEKKSFEPVTIQKQGNGFGSKFEYRDRNDYRDVYSYYFNENKIGEFRGVDIETTNDYIAVEYRNKREDETYPAGVKIWNSKTKRWQTHRIKWAPSIVGWIEE